MSNLSDRNFLIERLHKNGATRTQVKTIMIDLKDLIPEEEDEYWEEDDPLDKECDSLFSGEHTEEEIEHLTELSLSDKMRQIKIAQQNDRIFKERVIAKQKEVQEHEQKIGGEVKHSGREKSPERQQFVALRYGRSPLHENMAIGNFEEVEKFIKSGEFLDWTDNNGYTPKEMAYHLGITKVIDMFKRYKK